MGILIDKYIKVAEVALRALFFVRYFEAIRHLQRIWDLRNFGVASVSLTKDKYMTSENNVVEKKEETNKKFFLLGWQTPWV
ncbi:MAG: hypothetical protein LBE31_05970 [Deltaproteobacteria bacterium]|jgi:hypothetical protein|nr:hypothetical protein [Deltaproteobacteria bacterium]